jgi:hypothetical protein
MLDIIEKRDYNDLALIFLWKEKYDFISRTSEAVVTTNKRRRNPMNH